MISWGRKQSEKTYKPKTDKKEEQTGKWRNFLKILVDPPEPTVDIVAVHGLNPLDKQLHAEATWTAEDKLWLRDFLPKRVPDARVMLFGYNSNVAFHASTAGIIEQAENLLNQAGAARVMDPHRPLIFICHSLGGIVVKRALIHSSKDTSYGTICRSTFGVVFFGTPHRGGNHAEIGDVVAKIARSLSGSPSNSFMDALKDSPALKTITSDFRQLLEDIQFLTFYETQPLGRFGIIVAQDSAILGLPGTREKQIPLDANHREICKFASEDDPMYQQVADNIAKMANDACYFRTHSESNDEDTESNPTGRKYHSRVNESKITGDCNATVQLGKGNWSTTKGDVNETQQVGNRNRSMQDGNGNQTVQMATSSIDLWLVMGKLSVGTK